MNIKLSDRVEITFDNTDPNVTIDEKFRQRREGQKGRVVLLTEEGACILHDNGDQAYYPYAFIKLTV